MCHGAAALVPVTLYCDNELPAPNGSRGLRNRHAVCSGGGVLAGVAAALLPAVLLPAASASSASDLLEAPASENQARERRGNREGGGLRARRVRGTVR